MSDLYTYCITHKNLNYLNKFNINIIGAGNHHKDENYYNKNWFKDNQGENISSKNKNFGTLTSHYWFWKNRLNNHEKLDWIAFCHYRRFWVKENVGHTYPAEYLKDKLLTKINKEDYHYDAFLPNRIFVNKVKFTKLIKKGFNNYLRDPSILFNNKKNNIELHFDMFHGFKFLSKATDVLSLNDRMDFRNYIKQDSFYPFQIFICKPHTLNDLYEKTFEWIFECEKIFKNYKLEGYGKERLYDFLAERFFSFYFEKYTRNKEIPYTMIA